MRWWKRELAAVGDAVRQTQALRERAEEGIRVLEETERAAAPERARVDRKIRQNGFGHELELVVKVPIAGAH